VVGLVSATGEQEFLTVEEAAAILKVKPSTPASRIVSAQFEQVRTVSPTPSLQKRQPASSASLRAWVREGRMPAYRLGASRILRALRRAGVLAGRACIEPARALLA